MRKSSFLVIIILLTLIFTTACNNNEVNMKVNGNNEKIDTSKMQKKHCTRAGSAEGVEVELSYDLYYTGEILNILKSTEKVIGNNQETLKIYKDAYENIHKNYQGLAYYDATVEETNNSVTSNVTINYDKIDIDKLLEIEGEEDNIIENGQAKVAKWLELAKKFGTKCEDA